MNVDTYNNKRIIYRYYEYVCLKAEEHLVQQMDNVHIIMIAHYIFNSGGSNIACITHADKYDLAMPWRY